MDHLSIAERSRLMARVRSKDTQPELNVRRLVHGLGYRYALHRPDLPGKPDLVLPKHGAVIFISGCFWHRHHCPNGQRLPKTNEAWWREKLEGNRRRDATNQRKLRRMGWRVMVIWECQLKQPERIQQRIERFLWRHSA